METVSADVAADLEEEEGRPKEESMPPCDPHTSSTPRPSVSKWARDRIGSPSDIRLFDSVYSLPPFVVELDIFFTLF